MEREDYFSNQESILTQVNKEIRVAPNPLSNKPDS